MKLFLLLWVWQLPTGFPLPHIQPQNRMSQEKFELGRRLFYDVRLSWDGKQSCASCHQQSRAFTDGRAVAPGSKGRNTMTLTNVAYNPSFMWSNPKLTALEDQALVPMLTEMGVRGHEREILRRLRPHYGELSLKDIVNAIATFERALISGRSPYDRLVFDADHEALSESEWRGMQLFFSERTGCAACHSGFNFSGPVRYVGGRAVRPALVANGVTGGKFRVPTLRNVELTGPYMHDGSIATLDEVIERYAVAHKLELTTSECADMVAFMRSLTDREFTTDPRFADPSCSAGVSPALGGREAGETPALHVTYSSVGCLYLSRAGAAMCSSTVAADRRAEAAQSSWSAEEAAAAWAGAEPYP